MDEISALPRLEYAGIDIAIFLSRERDDARSFRQGYCYMESDHEPYQWDQTNFDETHYCLEGQIRLRVRDKEDREVILEAAQGEHIYLPAGYAYTLEATVVVRYGADPLLVVGEVGAGRTVASAPDFAPHWAPPGFVNWPHYAQLWTPITRWASAGSTDGVSQRRSVAEVQL